MKSYNGRIDPTGIADSIPELEFTEEFLSKSSLRGYSSNELTDLTVLIHKCEGRVFLTDRNGFYNDLLREEWARTKGNVIIILTCNRNSVPAD